jgi:hypothetical protein
MLHEMAGVSGVNKWRKVLLRETEEILFRTVRFIKPLEVTEHFHDDYFWDTLLYSKKLLRAQNG